MTDALIIDCTTGEQVERPLTAKEQVDRDVSVAEAEQERSTVEAKRATRDLIRSQVEAHMTDLALITGSSGTLTGAQLSNAVRVLARGQRRLIRLAVGLLDGTD